MKKLFTYFLSFTVFFTATAQDWNEIIKATASDREAADNFGYSVAISGDYAIVGAYEEDENASGGDSLENAGSAYIFYNNGGTWTEVQKITASDREEHDLFGESVAISGNYAIVGASKEDENASGGDSLENTGSAYIFYNNGGTWTEVQKITASDREAYDRFSESVSISGNYAIVGADNEDEDTSGGNSLTNAGSAYIFYNNGSSWTEVQKITASDREAVDHFGYSVAISGNYAIVGAMSASSAYIFYNNAGTWNEVQKIIASDRASNDQFGYSVAISGDFAIVGANYEDEDASGGNSLDQAGSSYIFYNNAGTWTEVQKITTSDREAYDQFGYTVAISGDFAIVGAPFEREDVSGGNTASWAGSSYIFYNNAGTWTEVQKIVASDRDSWDNFSVSVAISGDYALVGAYAEDEDTSGGNSLTNAGSAYIFYNCPSTYSTINPVTCDSLISPSGNYIWYMSGTYNDTLVNAAGCDSVVTLNLTINNNTGTDTQSACDSYTWIDGNTYTSDNNTATHTLTNAAGCDSVVTLDLTINNNTGTDTQTACDSYTWIDGNTYTSDNNTATHTLTNAAGCDSVVTLNLTINNSNTGTDTQTACDSFTWIDGNTYTSDNNTATHTITTTAGCDSVVTLDLTIKNSNTGTDVITTCDSYTWIDGNTYTSDNNTATHTLTNATGCDSVVTLDLTVNNSTTGTDVQTACDSYTWIDGNTYTTSNNTATDTLTNAAGCDSVVTLNLTINNSNTGTDVQTACDNYTWIDGNTYTSDNNTATHTLTNAAGCDSVVTLNLTINSVDTSVTQSDKTLTATETGATYQWVDCNNGNSPVSGATSQSFTPSVTGDYAVTVTKDNCSNTSGCHNVVITGIEETEVENTIQLYPNPTSDNITIDLGSREKSVNVSVYNVLGEEIAAQTYTNVNKMTTLLPEVEGIYFVKVKSQEQARIFRVVKH